MTDIDILSNGSNNHIAGGDMHKNMHIHLPPDFIHNKLPSLFAHIIGQLINAIDIADSQPQKAVKL